MNHGGHGGARRMTLLRVTTGCFKMLIRATDKKQGTAMLLTILSCIFALIFSACSTPSEKAASVDIDKLKVDIQAMEDAYAAAEKAKDADKVVAYYSDDAVSYNRNEEPT